MMNRCFLEMPDTMMSMSQIRKMMSADPRSGCTSTSMKKMNAYAPEMTMWRTLAISMCLREKYLARMTTKASFARSDGCREKKPNDSQLAAPWDTLARKNSEVSRIVAMLKSDTDTHVARRK